MAETSQDTFFAPAGREAHETLCHAAERLEESRTLRELLDAIPSPAIVLNSHRQTLAANLALRKLLGVETGEILGRRPGEIVGCSHAAEGPDGCGTGCHCRTCGAVEAILNCQASQAQVSRECRLLTQTADGHTALDLRVTASIFRLEGESFMLCVFEDISKQKRLEVLTRAFFHDVLNTAGGIRGFAQLLQEDLPPSLRAKDEASRLAGLADRLIDEIQCQRDLTRAENGQLEVVPEPVRTVELINDLVTLYGAHDVADGRSLAIGRCWDGSLLTDPRLLARVLGNMLKNALEATPRGGLVTIGCEEQGRQVVFRVHNPTVMSENVRLQVFQRSFSTKGQAGRGIGTYSIKLLGEDYLGGRVSFTSQEPEGTTFEIRLPKVRLAAEHEAGQ